MAVDSAGGEGVKQNPDVARLRRLVALQEARRVETERAKARMDAVLDAKQQEIDDLRARIIGPRPGARNLRVVNK